MILRNAIVDAISGRRVLRVRFQNETDFREIEPHVLYVDRAGGEKLDFFQVRGPSTSGSVRGWKCKTVSDIQEITPVDRLFRPRAADGYDPASKRYHAMICAVAE